MTMIVVVMIILVRSSRNNSQFAADSLSKERSARSRIMCQSILGPTFIWVESTPETVYNDLLGSRNSGESTRWILFWEESTRSTILGPAFVWVEPPNSKINTSQLGPTASPHVRHACMHARMRACVQCIYIYIYMYIHSWNNI